ncbi:hypothetical protein [Flavobacterium magnum]|uniref:hypothetical protein n=1 Tax=Flavobacterium magnum TaxID=2162713 RepID=UPI0011B21218|nr:hypothetical protein [Flavobacterium magnum]
MDIITSQFQKFTFLSYLTLIVVVLCYLVSLGSNLKEDRSNSPLWTLVISNIAFNYFLSTVPIYTDTYTKALFLLSTFCIVWYFWIKVNENQENEDRGFLQSGKDTITKGYGNAKQAVKNKASKTVGGGFLGDLAESAIDIGSKKTDSKLFGFLDFLGDSGEYFHPSRGTINRFRNLLILAMIIIMFYIT